MRWAPPPADTLKFNVDAAFISDQAMAAWCLVARNGHGEIIAARAGGIPRVFDFFCAELRAVEMAMGVAAKLGVVRLQIETDALLVAQAVNRRKPDFSKEAQLIEDLKVQRNLCFSLCEITHCPRDVNYAAQCLAKLGLTSTLGGVDVYDDDVPAELAVIVSGDSVHVV